ncbi:hypothetical protein [Amycolatopsis anabasis]|uniref:hypothetical protein n=1 Tax=Amycolatopsis anabasis TaxID=1840409 RepID=UPI00131AD2A0|nr:hypothetical protein [Amycolatopsis anabasis]
MGWLRGRRGQPGGYEDNAALKGFGGYEPADAPTPGYPPAPPQPEPEAPPPPKKRRSKAPYGLLAVLVLLGLGYLGSRANSDRTPEYTPPTTSRTPYTPPPQVVVPAVVPGWQSVAGGKGAYAYDVPPAWTPKPGTVHGWEADASGPGISLATSAFLGQKSCAADPDHDRGGSGVTTVKQPDAALAATETATAVAKYAFTPEEGGVQPTLAPGPPQQVQLPTGTGKLDATLVLVEVTVPPGPDACLPPRALVGAVAVKGTSGSDAKTAVLVAYADQAVPGEASRDDVLGLLRSYRLVPENQRTTIPATPTS